MANYPKFNPNKLTKAQLIMIIKGVDKKSPRDDSTCDEPGITISEAVYRDLLDRNILPRVVSYETYK